MTIQAIVKNNRDNGVNTGIANAYKGATRIFGADTKTGSVYAGSITEAGKAGECRGAIINGYFSPPVDVYFNNSSPWRLILTLSGSYSNYRFTQVNYASLLTPHGDIYQTRTTTTTIRNFAKV